MTVGAWDRWNGAAEKPSPYGDTRTYRIGADWLAGCATVADWGCGRGWLRTLIDPSRYVGIDGSATPHADIVADLADYRQPTDGVFMRHVIEHNHRWADVLGNAVASARQRMALILFTPLADTTHVIAVSDDIGVPDYSFALADLEPFFDGFTVRRRSLKTRTQYERETVFLLERQ